MSRITRAHLDARIATINHLTNSPAEPYRRVDGRNHANAGNFHLDSAYGGWQLVRMAPTGGCSVVVNTGFIKMGPMLDVLNAFIAGLEAVRMVKTEELVFTRAPSDINGNPRYSVDVLSFLKPGEDCDAIGALARCYERANSIGGRKMAGRALVVFQSYSIDETAAAVSRITGRSFVAVKG